MFTMLTGPDVAVNFTVIRGALVQALLRPHAAETGDVRQSEREAEQVFIAHIGNRVTAVLHRHAAAIPVVSGLRADELQRIALRVETKTAGGTKAALGGASVSQGGAKLVESRRGCSRHGCGLHRYLQECIATADRHLPEVVVGEQ